MSEGWWVGVPASGTTGDAHLLATLDRALAGTGRRAVRVLTHVDRSAPVARTTASWQLSPGAADHRDDGLPARLADALAGPVATRSEAPSDGRVVRSPGPSFTGPVPVADLVEAGLVVVGIGAPVGEDDLVDTLDGHLRPERSPDGDRLLVEPAGPGRWRPAEISDPHQCCGGVH